VATQGQKQNKIVWVSLLFATTLCVFFAKDVGIVLVLMFLAWFQNTSYAMSSRASNRNSMLYVAISSLAATAVFYTTLGLLVRNDMTLVLMIPYTVATVAGSLSGAAFSARIESMFGITTSTEKTSMPRKVKVALTAILGVVAIAAIISSPQDLTGALIVIAAKWGDSASFGLVRRSRNTSNVWYHVGASILNAGLWYILFRELVTAELPLALLAPYMFGSMMGDLTGQQVSMRIERFLGAGADEHIQKKLGFPWKPVVFVACIGFGSVLWIANDMKYALALLGLAVAQDISFALVSRSRNRNNSVYHAIASIFSNGVWFLTFRQISTANLPWDLFLPFATGRIMGSVTGVGISMQIERAIGATSDSTSAPASQKA